MNDMKPYTAASGTATASIRLNEYMDPQIISPVVMPDSIIITYKQIFLGVNHLGSCPTKIYKIKYSCIDGKWNQSNPIPGKIIPAQEEYFEFED